MNAVREAVEQVKDDWKSQKIRLVSTPLASAECDLLLETLSTHHTVKSLEMCLCEVTEDDIVRFAQQLKETALVGLQLVHVNMTEKSAKALATGLQESGVKKLDVAYNRLGPKGALVLAAALKDCGLESLLISRNQIRAPGAKHIAHAISTGNTLLKSVDVTKNRISDDGCIALAEAIPKSQLITVQMDINEITHVGVQAVCQALKERPEMEYISLGGNRLKDVSAMAIAEVLPTTKLEKLGLSSNDFTDEAFIALGRAIKESKTMQILELKGVANITDDGARQFLELVKTHTSFKSLVLDESGVSQPMRAFVTKHLEKLHSERTKILLALAVVKYVPRLSTKSKLKMLPVDLIRRVSDYME